VPLWICSEERGVAVDYWYLVPGTWERNLVRTLNRRSAPPNATTLPVGTYKYRTGRTLALRTHTMGFLRSARRTYILYVAYGTYKEVPEGTVEYRLAKYLINKCNVQSVPRLLV
jgi:hypothetical protein